MSLQHDRLITVSLNPRSERFETWLHIFGGEEIPLKNPMPGKAQLGDEKDVEVYALDIPRLTPGQRDRLVQWTAEKFGLPPQKVDELLESTGFPIREVDLIVAFSYRGFM